MIYQALVLRVDEDIEEEVLLRVGDIELACFASVCPYKIEVGLSYPVELHPVVFDDYSVTALPDETQPAVTRVGTGFAYVVTGKLSGDCLESGGLVIEDEVLQRDFGYLEGKMITMKIDRMDVEFLR
ncbi:hypothetical protein [Methylocaldum sp. SAD2]|jgi:hypothetical protein|uniref:hypothetical protein n=1 Tax=Methylocaldum sp. GT1BB TaxID=3438963 RepID=UPI00197CAA33